MSRKADHYSRISSFRELREEKYRLSLELRLTKTRLDMTLLELEGSLRSTRLFALYSSTLIKPFSELIRNWISSKSGRVPESEHK